MTDYVDDLIAYPHLTGIRDSILPELDARALPGLCEVMVGAGAEVAFGACSTGCDGMGWVRLAGAFASGNFPNSDTAPTRGPLLMAETFEIGLVRGMDLPDDPTDNDAMSVAVEDSGRLQLADMSALLAIICAYFRGKGIPFIVGSYTPYGPAGGCVGGSWQVTAQTGVAPKSLL